ncbi:MAG: hypothetical protein ACO1QR_05555, partial [Chthoniobacteraceae bacterium]
MNTSLDEAVDPIPARLSVLKVMRNCGAFLAAVVLGCTVLFSLRSFPDVPGIGPKYQYLREHKDRYDVLFVGSSRFYHQIIPKQFDARVAGGERAPLRSFNFGYDGMWPPESFYVVRQLLALRPASLKWVVIDLMEINANLDERNNSTQRMAYWHDWQHTTMAWRHLWYESRHSKDEKVRLIIAHGWHLAGQLANIGYGAAALDRKLMPQKPRKVPKEWRGTEGFDVGPDTPMIGAELKGYEETVARLRRNLSQSPVGPVFRGANAELVRDIRAAGAEPVFVIAPTLNARENFTGMPEGTALFAFNDPNEHPVLFDPAMHYDGWHLNG